MTTTKTQYRVIFDNPTAFSNTKASTMWYNSIEDCLKWMEKEGAELISRTLTKDSESFKKAMYAKFNS